eukprot:gb/GEZN01025447.1/.p1 GENE.gb/GEZN01025447.1/~~gb/GEZN01025447.1/.p1  ORF type:complete len:154 (+),score=17.86 gb/GEZN01025447.1/:36-497(+)
MGASGSSSEHTASKPIELEFTATDGKKVNLAEYRGKVVLIDFWATWCPPCVEEVPNLVETYNKYHSQGFEIIGISLDQSKEKLANFTHQNKMTWPQYFDGLGWGNKISGQFGIRSVPAMWLLNQEGKLVTTQARGGALSSYVKKLLDNPPATK